MKKKIKDWEQEPDWENMGDCHCNVGYPCEGEKKHCPDCQPKTEQESCKSSAHKVYKVMCHEFWGCQPKTEQEPTMQGIDPYYKMGHSCQPKTEGRECTRCGISYITESQFKYHKCCPEPLKEMPQVPCPKDCKDKDDAGHFHLAEPLKEGREWTCSQLKSAGYTLTCQGDHKHFLCNKHDKIACQMCEPLKETSCGIKHKHNYYDCCAECLTPVDGKHTKNCTHCKPSNTSWEDKIYKLLYEKSILCFGVRCINEDEWPIDEISDLLSQEQNFLAVAYGGELDKALSQERKRIREIVKKKEIDIDGSGDLDYQGGYNEALDDILSELDNQGEGEE